MHITKQEARQLLHDVFSPKFREILCALEAVETAIAAPLAQSIPSTLEIPPGSNITIIVPKDSTITVIEQ